MSDLQMAPSAKKPMALTEFIVLFAAITSLTALSIDTMLPALPQIGTALAVADPRDLQLIVGTVIFGMVFGELFAGPLSDAIGRRPVILWGMAIYSLGAVMAMSAESLEMLLLGRFVQGVGVSGPKIASRALIRDRYEGDEMARIISLIMMIFILVPMVAPALGQLIMWGAGWRAIFFMFVALAIVTGAWFHFRQEETLHRAQRRPFRPGSILKGSWELCRNRLVMSYTISAGMMFGTLLTFLSTAQAQFESFFGIKEMFPLYFAILSSGIGLAGLVNSRLVLKFGARRISLIALIGQISVSLAMIGLSRAQGYPEFPVFMGLFFLMFFCMGCLFGNLNALAMRPLGHMAGLGASFIASISSLLAFGLSVVIGRFFDGTLSPIALGYLFAALLALALTRWADRQLPPRPKTA